MLFVIGRAICFIVLKTFFRIRVVGREHIPKQGGFILAGNHASYLDPIALGVACPRKVSFMAKEGLFNGPFFSWLFAQLRTFPVRRNSADFSALREAMRRLKDGGGLVIFPEGGRSAWGAGAPSKVEPGIGFLSAKLNVPVIPAFIKGTDKALPRGAKFFRSSRISVCFGEQIFMERRMPHQDIADTIMRSIRHLSC